MLRVCNFEIIDRCNYNCEFCLKDFRTDQIGRMPEEYINWIKGLNCEAYVITGGEPSLNKQAIFKFLEGNNKIIVINTNLSNFTIDDIEKLNGRVNFHVDIPTINKVEYLKMTGSSERSYRNVLANLKVATNVQATIVVTETNKNSINQTIKVLASIYNINSFCVSPAISKNIESSVQIFKNLDDFASKHRTLEFYTLAYTKAFELSEPKYIKVTHKCTAGLDRFVIKANGDIVNCAWNTEKVIGRVGDNLDTILLNGKLICNGSRYCLGDCNDWNS